MKDIRRFFIILILGIIIGFFAKKLESRQLISLEIKNINIDNSGTSKIIENNNSLFFEKYSENFISKAFNFLNPNAKYDYDINRHSNDDSFIEIRIGDDLLYMTMETLHER